MTVTKDDNVTVTIPGTIGMSRPMEVSVNYRIVDSSNVRRIGWDRARNMYVIYKSGKLYVYMDVSRQRAVAAAYAKSVGHYINERVKGKFQVLQLGA